MSCRVLRVEVEEKESRQKGRAPISIKTTIDSRRASASSSITDEQRQGYRVRLKMKTLGDLTGIDFDSIGGAAGIRTPGLRIAKWTTGKTPSICLFKSCSHREILRAFPFLPVPYHRVSVQSCYFWPRIGHLEME
jgi:hypothetical protein